MNSPKSVLGKRIRFLGVGWTSEQEMMHVYLWHTFKSWHWREQEHRTVLGLATSVFEHPLQSETVLAKSFCPCQRLLLAPQLHHEACYDRGSTFPLDLVLNDGLLNPNALEYLTGPRICPSSCTFGLFAWSESGLGWGLMTTSPVWQRKTGILPCYTRDGASTLFTRFSRRGLTNYLLSRTFLMSLTVLTYLEFWRNCSALEKMKNPSLELSETRDELRGIPLLGASRWQINGRGWYMNLMIRVEALALW